MNLHLWVGIWRVCLESVESPHELRHAARVGQVWPLSALGATSRAMLAHLEPADAEPILAEIETRLGSARMAKLREELKHVRAVGVASTSGERLPAIAAIAAPILNKEARLYAAIAITGPASRWDDAQRDRWASDLREAALVISQALGYRRRIPVADPTPHGKFDALLRQRPTDGELAPGSQTSHRAL